MRLVSRHISVSSRLSAETLRGRFAVRNDEWRESTLGEAARAIGIIRWRIDLSGDRFQVRPLWGQSPSLLRPRLPLRFEGSVEEVRGGSQVVGVLRPTAWTWFSHGAFLLFMVVYPIALAVGTFLHGTRIEGAPLIMIGTGLVMLALGYAWTRAAALNTGGAFEELLTEIAGLEPVEPNP